MKRYFWSTNGIGAAIRARLGLIAIAGTVATVSTASPLPTPDLSLEIVPVWGAQSLVLGEEQGVDVAGAPVSVSRLDFLLSGVALRQENGDWVSFANCTACVRFDRGKGMAMISSVPLKRFTAIRFSIGLGASARKATASRFEPATGTLASLLRPDGELSCFSMEGRYQRTDGSFGTFGYHLAHNGDAIDVEVPLKIDATLSRTIRLAFDVEKVFHAREPLVIARDGERLDSENADRLTAKLKANLAAAFQVKSTTTDRQSSLAAIKDHTPPALTAPRAIQGPARQTRSAPNS